MIKFVNVPIAANDNILRDARPLTADDVEIIVEDNKYVLAQAIDSMAAYKEYVDEPLKGATIVLQQMPQLQRSIVWYGSSLKRPDVDELSLYDGSLLKACLEVIQVTLVAYPPNAVEDFIKEKLTPISSYLREGKA